MSVDVRCPAESCRRTFGVPERVLGRSTHCPTCGTRLTARPAGIEAQLRRQQARLAAERTREVRVAPERLDRVVLLDNIRSAWNVGSIFRTADACGFRRLYLAGITATPPRPDIAKTALGAERAVGWEYHADAGEALASATADGYVPVILDNGDACPVDEFEWPERTCLVVGNEVAGISAEIRRAGPREASIPMLGVKDSLNVAVAFGIAAFAAARAVAGARARVG